MQQAILTRFRRAPMTPATRAALVNWLLVWVVLANLGFSLLYFVGGPPRVMSIIVFGGAGLLVRGHSWIVRCLTFIAALAYAVILYSGSLFNLSIFSLSRSVVFMSELNAFNSLEYVLVGAFLCGLVIAACLLLRRPARFSDPRALLVAAAAVAAVALFDVWMGIGARGHYSRLYAEDSAISSAVSNSEVAPASGKLERHLLIVMVEALGVPMDNPEMSRLIFSRYRDPAVRSRFEVRTGPTTLGTAVAAV